MSRTKLMMGSCFALALALLAWGCAGKAGPAAPLNTTTGQHPANWMQVHYAEYVKAPEQCRTCHGSTVDPAQAGGVSKVSCFTCHATGVPHPAGWAAGNQHGRLGAQQAPSADPKDMAGLAHCAKCHGTDYLGGITTTSCKACHTKAPHPVKPWRGTPATQASHVATNVANAPECFKCHAAGANSTLQPLTVPPAGTAPGCYNDTMCHAKKF
jgi:hypothetical protein